jgi:hypothetical protein
MAGFLSRRCVERRKKAFKNTHPAYDIFLKYKLQTRQQQQQPRALFTSCHLPFPGGGHPTPSCSIAAFHYTISRFFFFLVRGARGFSAAHFITPLIITSLSCPRR